MTSELKGRFATYTHNGKTIRLSLNAVKTNFGADIARTVLEKKHFSLGDTISFDLELLPGEKTAEETHREKLKVEFCKALYQDLSESYPSFTYAWLLTEADRLIAGGQPGGGPSMFLHRYLIEAGLIKTEEATK